MVTTVATFAGANCATTIHGMKTRPARPTSVTLTLSAEKGRGTVMDEKPYGIYAWVILIVVVNALWISIDVWLGKHGHEYLTTEFREGLRNELWGPFLVFITTGTFAAFMWHMFIGRQR